MTLMFYRSKLTEAHSSSALKQGQKDDPTDRAVAGHWEDDEGEDEGGRDLPDQDDELGEDLGNHDLVTGDASDHRPIENILI